jgi:hypothetical protein
MRKGDRMKVLCFLLLVASPLFAAIDGTVVNKTSGKPQSGVNITLVKPGAQGMQTIGTAVSDATGHFRFEKDQPGGGPQLLQAAYKGVNYNKLMTPNIPTSNVELDVFEATKSPAAARVSQHMLILQPTTTQFTVNEMVIVANAGNTTYNDPAQGGVRFYLPAEANGQVKVSAQGQQGMVLPRVAEKTEEDSIYKVDYPIKPGETQFDISYVLPVGSPLKYQGRVVGVKGIAGGPLRLIAPAGVTLSGADLQSIGQEPKTQATIYNVTAQRDFSVDVTGFGSLHAGEDANAVDTSESPQLTEGLPHIYSHMAWMVVLAFAILGVGLVMLFKASPVK